MYKIAVLGGMGPLATVRFYEKLVLNTPAQKDSDHMDLVILNHATLPDRTETIIKKEGRRFLDAIKEDFDIINELKVKAIAIPCNTSHYYYDEMKKFTTIPIINMVEETIIKAKAMGFEKVCVFSTQGTDIAGIYPQYARENGLDVEELDQGDKKEVMDMIYRIKGTNQPEHARFNKIAKKYLKPGVVGILACTELSLIDIDDSIKPQMVDAMDVLVEKVLAYGE